MSRFFAWNGDNPQTIYWRKYAHPQINGYKVYLDDTYYNLVLQSTDGTWKAVVTQTPKSRGPALGGFATRYAATQYMFWAHGITDYDNRP